MKKFIIILVLFTLFVSSSCTLQNTLYSKKLPPIETTPITNQNDKNNITIPENSKFEVHYIDVGQADAALVICDDKKMLIDGGNVSDSSLIVSYLKKNNIDFLDYIIGTHAHEDHIGGLSGALSVVSVGKVYAPETEANSKAYRKFKKKVQLQGLQITNPKPNETFMFGSSTIKILAPISENVSDINNTSIVLKITYGSTSFLFAGDAEREAEQAILNSGYDISANVLKIGHHGSANSTSYTFLREIMPEYAIISVGQNNSYGHPAEEILSRLRDCDTKVYRTDLQGDIIVRSDGKKISVLPSKNADIETNPTLFYKPDIRIHS